MSLFISVMAWSISEDPIKSVMTWLISGGLVSDDDTPISDELINLVDQ